MSDYLSSFLDPVVRRLSESSGYLPTVPDLRTWYPTRLWTTSPPPSIGEVEDQDSGAQLPGQGVQRWATRMPSPPWDPMDTVHTAASNADSANNTPVTDFPSLDPPAAPRSRPAQLETLRANSDHSLNPMRELTHRARLFEDNTRPHAQSDPTTTFATTTLPDTSRSTGTTNDGPNDGEIQPRMEGSGLLPEDDGMGLLRKKIGAIWGGSGTSQEKAQLIHQLMMERYRVAKLQADNEADLPTQNATADGKLVTASMLIGTKTQPGEPTSRSAIEQQALYYNLAQEDLLPCYAPLDPAEMEAEETGDEPEQPQLGCKHYKRNVKMQCNTCKRWYTCRLCHDEVEDHSLPRRETKNMLCMFCNTPQAASQTCRMCGYHAACYYCSVCKLWNNDPEKAIYHCDDCGICRLGQGLGKDFFHCKTCVVCMSITAESTHRCIEQSTKCDCPICGEYLFTSSKSVVFMRCGHAIHERCFKELCRSSYKCPMCSKSITNMESQFRNLDRQIASQPMPEEYRNQTAYVYCNDCTLRGITDFHWLGVKCAVCESYNTTMLDQMDSSDTTTLPEASTAEVISEIAPLPLNVTDEAVPIPNSRAASRRPSTAISANGDRDSPWLRPQYRGARSLSPVVGNYFGLDRREQPTTPSTVNNEGEDMDFWGRPFESPLPGEHTEKSSDDEGEEELEEESSSDEEMEDNADDDEDDDPMDLLGHR